MIKGIHHIALRCHGPENYQRTLDFYENIIGMKVTCSWGYESGAASMLELNGDVLEIFASGAASYRTGSINHYAFLTDDPDGCIEKVREAGYPVITEPTDVDLLLNESGNRVYPLRFAYCVGPVGEIIEFFCERDNRIDKERVEGLSCRRYCW